MPFAQSLRFGNLLPIRVSSTRSFPKDYTRSLAVPSLERYELFCKDYPKCDRLPQLTLTNLMMITMFLNIPFSFSVETAGGSAICLSPV